MATTRFADHLLEGDHASRPDATDVPVGTLYACSDHALIYQSDGATWSTWATLGGGAVAAEDVSYDNGSSGLSATDVQDAIDELEGLSGGGGGSPVLFAATATSNVTVSSTTEGTPTSVLSLGSQTYAAVPITIEFYCPGATNSAAGGGIIGELWEDGSYLCRFFDWRNDSGGGDGICPIYAVQRITPSAASHTYEVRAFRAGSGTSVLTAGAGTGGTGIYSPMLLQAKLA